MNALAIFGAVHAGNVARLGSEGHLVTKKTAAPADGTLAASEAAMFVDPVVGAPVVKWRVKDSAGTAFTVTPVVASAANSWTATQTFTVNQTFNRGVTVGLGTTADSGLVTINAEDVTSKALAIFQVGGVEILRLRRHSSASDPTIVVASAKALRFQAGGSGSVPILVLAATGQTGDLQRWSSEAELTYGRLNKDGYFMTRKTAAPADADVATSEVALWWDATNGLGKLKGKKSDATVVNLDLGSTVIRQTTNLTEAGTGAATTETDLQTYSLPASTLVANGGLEIMAAGTMSGTTGDRTVKLYFGGSVIAQFTRFATVGASEDWLIRALVYNDGATGAQKFVAWIVGGGDAVRDMDFGTLAVDTTAAVTIKTTGTTADAGDEISSEVLHVTRFA